MAQCKEDRKNLILLGEKLDVYYRSFQSYRLNNLVEVPTDDDEYDPIEEYMIPLEEKNSH